MININEYFSQNEKLSLINEYLLGKNKIKGTSYIEPKTIYNKLSKGKHLMNLKDFFDSVEKYLKNGERKDHMIYLLDVIDKAIDEGYILNNAKQLTNYYEDTKNEKHGWWDDTKAVMFINHYGDLVINFADMSKLTLLTINVKKDTNEFEVYVAIGYKFESMLDNLKTGFFSWELDYDTSITPEIEKFKETINKRLGL